MTHGDAPSPNFPSQTSLTRRRANAASSRVTVCGPPSAGGPWWRCSSAPPRTTLEITTLVVGLCQGVDPCAEGCPLLVARAVAVWGRTSPDTAGGGEKVPLPWWWCDPVICCCLAGAADDAADEGRGPMTEDLVRNARPIRLRSGRGRCCPGQGEPHGQSAPDTSWSTPHTDRDHLSSRWDPPPLR